MKLGKKQKTDDEAADSRTNAKPAKTKASSKNTAANPSHKRLSSVALKQSLVVFLAGLVSAALMYFLSVVPAESRRYQMQTALAADTAAAQVNQQLALLQSVVAGLGTQGYVREAFDGEGSLPAAMAALTSALPDVQAVYLFPYGDIPRTSREATLGFAGLDLARRAETGRPVYPDAFPRDDQWYLQMAAPIRRDTGNAVVGSVLAVFDIARLKPLLSGLNDELNGQFEIVQSVSGSERVIVSNGSGEGAAVERGLFNPDWKLRFKPASAPTPFIGMVAVAILVIGPALLAAILVWVLLGAAQRNLRQ
jgi:phosphomannomutase/phosphoglucomutase